MPCRLPLSILMPAALLPAAAFAGHVTDDVDGYRFHEDFAWQGNHASHVNAGNGTTVWWDESSWDVRGDSSYTAITPMANGISNRFHVDIHRAMSADPRDGRVDNGSAVVGGDGGPGVGIMHVDFQDIVSARLRNPMLIADGGVATVSFYAPLFNTSGHWWEIAITPATTLTAAEYTGVPGQDPHGFPNGSGGGSVGPGHGPYADSINLVMIGSSDVPCLVGWRVRSGITRTVGGATTHYVHPVDSQAEYLLSDPDEAQTLLHWTVEYRRDGISLYADFDEDGTPTLIESWALDVPWSEVHLHLLGVAYQADHHPQEPCYLGHIREIGWREIEVAPVKFAATDVYPKNEGSVQTPRALGFLGYDLRDIQRFGEPVAGVPQPNVAAYGNANAGRWCNDAGYPCFGQQPQAVLDFTLPARLAGAEQRRLLLDTKDRSETDASLTATVNGVVLGRLAGHDRVVAAETQAWVRNAIELPASVLVDGDNRLTLSLETGAYADRIEFEFGFAGSREHRIFRDGFGARSAAKSCPATADWRHPDPSTLRIERRFGAGPHAHCSN